MADKQEIHRELSEYMQNNERNWVRLVAVTKRLTDGWMQKSMNRATDTPFKTSFMKFLTNISLNGVTNQELAKRAMQPKQAMSRTVKELEAEGLIKTEKNKRDKRSARILLTENGQNLLLTAKKEQMQLTDTYKKLVGEENFAIAVEVLHQITTYHQSLNQADDEE